MTRKHFEAVAKIIKQNSIPDAARGFDEGFDSGVFTVASDLADFFATTNPNFDRARFMRACQP